MTACRIAEMLSDISLTTLIKRMHEQKLKENGLGYIDLKENRIITTHGFRSAFPDWSTDKTDYPREVCEHVLAHKLRSRLLTWGIS